MLTTSIRSSLNSLKELVTILTGLAIVNALLFYVTDSPGTPLPLEDLRQPARLFPFLLLLGNLVRFFHGNLRHLDELRTEPEPNQRRPPSLPWRDYFFITSQTLLFGIAGFYQQTPRVFFPLLSSALAIDLVMFAPKTYSVIQELKPIGLFNSLRYSAGRRKLGYETLFIANNLVVGLLFGLGITVAVLYRGSDAAALNVGFAFFATNILVDYYSNWHFYFPAEKPRIFLAAPFTGKLDAVGIVRRRFQKKLERFIRDLGKAGATVDSAHDRELFGLWKWPAAALTLEDFRQIRSDDLLVAVMDGTPSGGVKIELGWASMLGKPIFLAHLDSADVIEEALQVESKLENMVPFTRATFAEHFAETLPQVKRFWSENHSYAVTPLERLKRNREALASSSGLDDSKPWLLCSPGETFHVLSSDPKLRRLAKIVRSLDIPSSRYIDLMTASFVVVVLERDAVDELIDIGWMSAFGVPLKLYNM